MDVRGLDAVIVFEKGPHPDIGRDLVFRHADLAAFEVGRLLHAIGAHTDRVVAEGAREKAGTAM